MHTICFSVDPGGDCRGSISRLFRFVAAVGFLFQFEGPISWQKHPQHTVCLKNEAAALHTVSKVLFSIAVRNTKWQRMKAVQWFSKHVRSSVAQNNGNTGRIVHGEKKTQCNQRAFWSVSSATLVWSGIANLSLQIDRPNKVMSSATYWEHIGKAADVFTEPDQSVILCGWDHHSDWPSSQKLITHWTSFCMALLWFQSVNLH